MCIRDRWTLKRDGDAWTGFESWSFGAIAQEPERFERAMRDMCEATPEQCRSGCLLYTSIEHSGPTLNTSARHFALERALRAGVPT